MRHNRSTLSSHILNQAFTLVELAIFLAVLGICSVSVMWYFNETHKNYRAHYLAERSDVYAKLFAAYIINNESAIAATIPAGGTVVVNYTTLQNNGYITPGLSDMDNSLTIPCVAISENSYSKMLHPMLFYVTNVAGQGFPFDVTKRATLALGGKAGYMINGGVISRGGWSIPAGSPYFTNANITACGAPYLAPNSLVVNLAMLPSFNQLIHEDLSLARAPIPGSRQMHNAVKTDIILTHSESNIETHHGLFFANGNNILTHPILTSGSDIRLANNQASESNVVLTTNLLANTIRPLQATTAWSVCNSAKLYNIMSEDISNNDFSNIQFSAVMCSYNPSPCRLHNGNTSDYCYVPLKSDTIRMVNNTVGGSGWMGYSYTCPTATPIAIDGMYNPKRVHIEWLLCPGNSNCNGNGHKLQASNYILGSGQFILTTQTINGNNYNIAVGYTAQPGTDTSNCNAICQLIGSDSGTAGPSPTLCSCIQNSQLRGLVQSITTSGLGNIKYVTCTNRTYTQQI